jgi:Circularly permutated YpsA SLOG family
MKIISGGQTGVDRAALDFAMAHGLEHGGWCPRDRAAEDGAIPLRYQLQETESSDPAQRTERNVTDSDATLIIARERQLFGGSLFTRQCAEKHHKPLLVICESDDREESVARLRTFIEKHRTLNIAGPRESEAPGLSGFVWKLLSAATLSDSSRSGLPSV